ncbi:hypothetical protein SeMB42_g05752 [Synchytrium endobioticum]|uniref:Ubiquitin-like protease family profile domain-containing protein n=1 Tax=Synchytrium endobioticum TaxID=286115 RepID=A0A507CPP2_9FUNG|nr:hypothetical protein SeMB42_g05752 [Synchytrium endobioticum]TPX46475.1 hypothetical protein SeLEV6574_g03205 [Synchytrium endobioticum]
MPYLLYGDVQLEQEDVDLLTPPLWLNDSLIEFYYEYLERETYPPSTGIAFLRPALVQLIAHQQDPSSLKSALPPNLSVQRAIFCPMTDVTSNTVGGSHWNLLVFYRDTNTFYYYDSSGGYNLGSAQEKIRNLYVALSDENANVEPKFAQVATPSQINGYDCGCYVLAITDLLARRLSARSASNILATKLPEKPGDVSQWSLSEVLAPDKVHGQRHRLRELIERLRK